MARDWSLSRFVRLYVNESADEAAWDWQARCVWPLLIKAADRAGVIETTKGAKGLAAVIRMPVDVVTPAVEELLADGCLIATPRGFLLRNYYEAQTVRMAGSQRQAEYKARERAIAALDDSNCKEGDSEVTRGDTRSRAVTAGDAEVTPRRSETRREEEREGDPAAPAPLSLVPPEPAGPDTAAVLWARQNEHRTGAGLRALKLTAVARKAIAARLKDYTPDELAAVVDEDAASARRTGDWQWFNGETNWRASNVARTYGRIGTQRAGPIGTANHRPSPPPTLPRITVENAT